MPVHDQADHVADIVTACGAALDRIGRSYELILVENGSTDASPSICDDLALRCPEIRAIHLPVASWARAVKAGLRVAQGEIICFTNSARTSPQDLTLSLLYALANPGTVIKASRKVRDSFRRRLGSLLYNLECRLLLDLPQWDVNGTPKVFPRSYGRLLELTRDDDVIDAEFNLVCQRDGYPMLEVPILAARRHGGRSTTGYRAAMKMYWGAFQLWLDERRRVRRDRLAPS